jgi:hypothetical protein
MWITLWPSAAAEEKVLDSKGFSGTATKSINRSFLLKIRCLQNILVIFSVDVP